MLLTQCELDGLWSREEYLEVRDLLLQVTLESHGSVRASDVVDDGSHTSRHRSTSTGIQAIRLRAIGRVGLKPRGHHVHRARPRRIAACRAPCSTYHRGTPRSNAQHTSQGTPCSNAQHTSQGTPCKKQREIKLVETEKILKRRRKRKYKKKKTENGSLKKKKEARKILQNP